MWWVRCVPVWCLLNSLVQYCTVLYSAVFYCTLLCCLSCLSCLSCLHRRKENSAVRCGAVRRGQRIPLGRIKANANAELSSSLSPFCSTFPFPPLNLGASVSADCRHNHDMTADYSRVVVAFGSNLFGQLGGIHDGSIRRPAHLHEGSIQDVIAATWSQAILRSRDGQLRATGLDADAMQARLEQGTLPRRWLGKDNMTAWLEQDGALHALDPKNPWTDTRSWKDAAIDSRGRVVAIDETGRALLFDTLSLSSSGDPVVPIGGDKRFESVQAGWSHFILLAKKDELGSEPVWLLGDPRFGVVPTDIGGETRAVSCSFFDGLPSRVAQVCAGGRHALVRTQDGDVYAWGWNGEGQIAPHDEGEMVSVSSPMLVDIDTDADVVDMACGSAHSVLVDGKGHVWVAGSSKSLSWSQLHMARLDLTH